MFNLGWSQDNPDLQKYVCVCVFIYLHKNYIIN